MTAVLISHFFPERSLIQRTLHWGRFGVLLFFVLSGFLITGLLLRGRDAVIAGEATRGSVFRAFVIRRALRIAPIYYLVVLIGWAAGYGPIADLLPWHLTYTGNIALTYFHKSLAQATHLWSLCVEEQFYLMWPVVVLFARARAVPWIALGLVMFSFAYEAHGAIEGRSFEETHLVLQGCMDALGLGALLALAGHGPREQTRRLTERLGFYAALAGAPLFFFAQGFRYQVGLRATDLLAYRIPGDLGLALMSLALVQLATTDRSSVLKSVLSTPPLQFVGRISYGIYLYHLFLIPIGRKVAVSFGVDPMPRGAMMFWTYSAISILLATVSWYAIEAPINRQKVRFPYPPSRGSTGSALSKD